jgi:hypothetical protein
MFSARKYIWLAAILAAEVVLFAWKCNHFFNGDSLFFFSHEVGTWSDIARVFRAPDHLWQYRPLTFVIFSFLLKPLFGTNPLGYNLFPLVIHAVSTLVVFGILGRLGLTERAALLGTFFFGVHSTAFYVTYGVAFLPDLSYSLFYLLSIFWFVKYLRFEKYGTMALSVLFFILALFCKEASITLPVVVFAIAFLWGEQGLNKRPTFNIQTARAAFIRIFYFLLFGGLYLCFHLISKAGRIYAPGVDHPHHMELSLQSLRLKYKYLKWAFNLPDGLVFSFEGISNYLIAIALLVFILPFVLFVIRRLCLLDPLTWIGCVWFVVALGPVLFLRNLTMNHNLYVPLVGISLVFGAWLHETLDRFAHKGNMWVRNAVVAYVLIFMIAVFHHNRIAVRESWIGAASIIAETSLRDLKNVRPVLADGATLYFVDKSSLGSLRWYYDYGTLVRLFYTAKSLDIRFIDHGYALPDRREMPAGAMVFEYDGSHLLEVSGGV